ncbi:MAG TPA: sigma 54-interacting transcriptional regulator [Calditrichia bacterium]|nr:sigma 54-interacting transcriptional regulator [Calditrichia bacterium]
MFDFQVGDPKTVANEKSRQLIAEMAALSDQFMEIAGQLKSLPGADAARESLNRLFMKWMAFQQQFGHLLNGEPAEDPRQLQELEKLRQERERLEILYTSGIQFSTETEKHALMSKAIDTVIKALKADAGFIILVDQNLDITAVVARNINPEQQNDARDLSTSVIREALKQSEPVQLRDLLSAGDRPSRGSIVRLGISSAICVPLMSGNTPIGAVYLDRRQDQNLFAPADLRFLSAFAAQIVAGVEVSSEIARLEDQIISDVQPSEDDIRQQFHCPEIVGHSRPLLEVLHISGRIAPTDATVIILGENGTGKELLARGIHHNSRRGEKAFVAINCSAIPDNLLESELFGYEAGAFTGAGKAKPGKIEMADGGTLFLDEIGELDINLQAKLLRFLQTGDLERLGSVRSRRVDVRVVAATNRPLGKMIREGQFREDLYYRLKVIELTLPPLRERPEDILPLAKHFLKQHDREQQDVSLSPEALDCLENHPWPGNIRELENALIRGILLSRGGVIRPGDLPAEISAENKDSLNISNFKNLSDAENEFRRRYIMRVLNESGSKSEAAERLGVNRTYLYKLLEQLNLS